MLPKSMNIGSRPWQILFNVDHPKPFEPRSDNPMHVDVHSLINLESSSRMSNAAVANLLRYNLYGPGASINVNYYAEISIKQNIWYKDFHFSVQQLAGAIAVDMAFEEAAKHSTIRPEGQTALLQYIDGIFDNIALEDEYMVGLRQLVELHYVFPFRSYPTFNWTQLNSTVEDQITKFFTAAVYCLINRQMDGAAVFALTALSSPWHGWAMENRKAIIPLRTLVENAERRFTLYPSRIPYEERTLNEASTEYVEKLNYLIDIWWQEVMETLAFRDWDKGIE